MFAIKKNGKEYLAKDRSDGIWTVDKNNALTESCFLDARAIKTGLIAARESGQYPYSTEFEVVDLRKE